MNEVETKWNIVKLCINESNIRERYWLKSKNETTKKKRQEKYLKKNEFFFTGTNAERLMKFCD